MEHRKLLLQNYQLSPEVVSMCSNDIENYCQNNEIGRRTIHCLMDHSKPSRSKNRIGKSCQKAVCCFILLLIGVCYYDDFFYMHIYLIISYKNL